MKVNHGVFVLFICLQLTITKSGAEGTEKGPRFTVLSESPRYFLNTLGTTLDCAVSSGSSTVSHTWLCKSELASEVAGYREVLRNGSLYFPPFNQGTFREDIHDAEYFCQVSTDYGSIISHPIALKALISTEQRFAIDVEDQVIPLGSNARLSYRIVPTAISKFVENAQWLFQPGLNTSQNFTEIDVGDHSVDILHDGSLYVREVARNDALVWYKCVARHKVTGSKVQSHADIGLGLKGAQIILTEVTESSKPTPYYETVDLSLKKGDTIRLVCATYGYPPARTFNWFKNEEDLLSESTDVLTWVISGSESGSVYRCEASNALGASQTKFTVNVQVKMHATMEPRVSQISIGSSIQLNCSFHGNPLKTLHWFLNGIKVKSLTLIKGQTHDVLKLSEVSVEQLGIYQCQISNGDVYETVTSEVQLKETRPSILSSFEENVFEPVVDSVILECTAIGNPTPRIEWYHNEEKVVFGVSKKFLELSQVVSPFVVSSRFNINPIELLDSGVFTCKAVNELGQEEASNFVHVKGQPDVLPMPDRVVLATGVTQLPCYIAGFPIDQITWFHGGRQLPHSYRQSVAVNGTLIIRDTAKEDGGVYTCEAKGGGFIDSYSFEVAVKFAPQIAEFSMPESVLDESVAVICAVSRGDAPVHIQWYKDGSLLHSGENQFVIQFLPPMTSYLSIQQIEPFHAGNYTCVASNQVASVSHTATLHVKTPPHFSEEPKDAASLLGASVEIPCKVLGSPPPEVTWDFVPNEGNSFSGYMSSSGGSKTGSHNFTPLSDLPAEQQNNFQVSGENGSLLIGNVSLQVPRVFLCRASNGVGREIAKSVQLTLHVPPFFSEPNENQSARIGQFLVLSCLAFGNKPLGIVWFRDNRSLSSFARSNYEMEMEQKPNGTLSYFKIKSATRDDSANYTCLASNAHGSAQRSIFVRVLELPDAPSDVRVILVNSTFVELEWKLGFNGNTPLDYVLISYHADFQTHHSASPEHEGPVIVEQQLKLPAQSSKVRLTNLVPATLYKIEISIVNSIGSCENSPLVSVFTSEAAPSAPPSTLKLKALSSDTVLVSWKQPEAEGRNGKITEYEIVYFNKERPSGEEEETIKVPASHQTTLKEKFDFDQQTQIDGLSLFTTYSFKIRAKNSAGMGPFSEPQLITTLEGVPSVAPGDVEVTRVSRNLHVKFDSIPTELLNGRLLGYKVRYFKTEEPNEVTFYPSLDRSILLSHVAPHANYSISVCGYTQAGDGLYSQPVVVQTAEAPPSAPEYLKVVLKAPTDVLVSWTPPLHHRGVLLFYKICFEKQAIVSRGGESCVEVPSQFSSYVKSDVSPGETYSVWVSAINGAGLGEPTETQYIAVGFSSIVPPKIYSFGETVTSTWMSDVLLDCLFVGVPEPTRSWYRNGKGVSKPLGEDFDSAETKSKHVLMRNNSLLIKSVVESDSGIYTCAITNMDGSDSINYTLRVLAPPSAPLLQVLNRTNGSVEIGWIQKHQIESFVNEFTVHYRQKETPFKDNLDAWRAWINVTIPVDSGMDGTGRKFGRSFVADNLLCGQTYEFFLTSTNAVGESEPGDKILVNTLGSAPVNPARELFVEELASSSALLNLSTIQARSCPLDTVMLYLQEDSSQMTDEAEKQAQRKSREYKVSGNRATFVLTKLHPATYYDMKVVANNSAGATQTTYKFATHTLDGQPMPEYVDSGGLSGSPALMGNPTVIGVVGGACLVALFLLCLVLLCILRAIKHKRKRRLYHKSEAKHRLTMIRDYPPALAHTLNSDRGALMHMNSAASQESTSSRATRTVNFNRTNSYLQDMANSRGGSNVPHVNPHGNSLLAIALTNNGTHKYPTAIERPLYGNIHGTQPNLSQFKHAPKMYPDASSPLFLSHGNLALSLGFPNMPQNTPHKATSQANSASNLASGLTPGQTSSIYNSFNQGNSSGVHSDLRPTVFGGLSSSMLQTFSNEKGDDSGIDEDGEQSPTFDNQSRAGSSVAASFKSPSNQNLVGAPFTGRSNSQPRLVQGQMPADNARANLLKEELQKHMWTDTPMFPQGLPPHPGGLPASQSFIGGYPSQMSVTSPGSQPVLTIPRQISTSHIPTADPKLPPSDSIGNLVPPPPIPPRESGAEIHPKNPSQVTPSRPTGNPVFASVPRPPSVFGESIEPKTRNGVPQRPPPQPVFDPPGSLMRSDSNSNKSLPGLYMQRQMMMNNSGRNSAIPMQPSPNYTNQTSLVRNNRPLSYAMPNVKEVGSGFGLSRQHRDSNA